MRRSIQLITLHCVLAAAEDGSILAASKRIGIHHSAISRRIRELEAVLGVKLFDRHPGGVRPTEVGERFLERTRTILADLEGTLSVIGRAASSSVTIGFEEALPASQVVCLATSFIRRRPKVGVRFREDCSAKLAEALHRRELDLLITFDPGADRSDLAVSLWRNRVLVILPAGHLLASGEFVEWNRLRSEVLLIGARVNASWCEPLLERLEPSAAAHAVVRHDLGRECLLALVREGLGFTLLREDELPSNRNGLAAIPLYSAGEPVRIPCFARWLGDNTNPVLATLVHFLREQCRN